MLSDYSDYFLHLGILCCIYALLAQGFNISFGKGGLFNLSHVASYAIGAYCTAILSTDLQWGFWACMGSSILSVSLFSLIVGLISLRLSDDYFAIGTLAFSFLIQALLINWKSLTRGVLGIAGIPRPEFKEFFLSIGVPESILVSSNSSFFLAILLSTLFILGILYATMNSPFTRQLRMQSEHPLATQALGVSLVQVRNMAFVISAILAGISGSFFAYYLSYIDPSSFALHEMVFVLMVVVVGRPGAFWGVLISSLFLVLLPEPLRYVELSPGILGPMRQLLYALILFGAILIGKNKLFPVQRGI